MNAAATRRDEPPDQRRGTPAANTPGADTDPRTGQSSAPRTREGRRAWAATAAVALVGLITTVVVFALARQWEQERWLARFELAAQRRIADIQREIEIQFEVLHSLRALFDASELVEEREFETFASQALARHPGLAALAYAPRVPHARRAFAETELGGPITHALPDGVLETAPDRDVYFPVWYAQGVQDFNLPRSFDTAADPAHADALGRAIASGQLAVSAPLPIASVPGSDAAVLVFLAVTEGGVGEPARSPNIADRSVEGAVVGVVDIDHLIERALRPTGALSLHLHIHDEGAPGRALYLHGEHPVAVDAREHAAAHGGPLFSGRLLVGGRTWVATCAPAEPFPGAGPGAWALLVTGLLITSLLTTNVLTSISRREARALVEERTRDLRDEVAEHKRAKAELEESQIRFRQVADNIDSVFWIAGEPGKRLDYVSRAFERIWGRPVAELMDNPRLFLQTIHPEDHATVADLMRKQDTAPFTTEYRIVRPDGAVRWIRDRSFPLRIEGAPRTAGLAEDITDERLANEALRRSEEHLRQVFEAGVDPIWDWDIVADRTTFSPGWAPLLGYEPPHPGPDAWEDLIHPDDRQRVRAAIHAALEGASERYEAEYRLRTRTGQFKWVLSRGRVVEREGGPTGRALRMIGSITDITDRRRVEDALRESEARQRAILEAVPDCMFRMRRDGTYVDYHAPEGAILLCPPEEFLGRRCADVLPRHLAEPCERAITAALDTGRVQTYSYSAGPEDAPRYWEVRVAPCGEDEVLAIVRDISEQRRAQDALRESEARYRLIVETAHEGVWTTDAAGRTTFVNARMAEMLGHAPADMIGKPMREFMDDAARGGSAVADLHAERRRRGVQEEHDLCLRRRDGTPLWALVSTAPVRDERGAVAGAIAMVTDITARKMAEEELRRQEARYRAVVEGQAELVCRYTPDGEVTFANDAFCRFFGRRRDRVVGGPLGAAAADHADGERFAAALCAPGPEPAGPRTQTPLTDAQGRRRWIAWSRRPIADIGGRTVEIQAVGRDVTDAKLAEEALRRSEEFNRRLIEAIPGGLVVIGADGSVRQTNALADEFLGLNQQENSHRKVGDWAMDTFRDDGTPMAPAEYPVTECLATGRPAGPRTIGVRRPDGTIAWGIFRAVPLPSDDGDHPDAAAVMFLDITERRRIEQAHRAGEERYRLVAEQTGQLIYDYDLDSGRIVWVGAIADVTGHTPERFASVDADGWIEMIHPDDRVPVLDALARAREEGSHFRTEYRFRRADGSYADILDNGVFLRDQTGATHRMLGTMQDVTESKRRAAALAESESLYRLLAENATDMIARLTPDGEYLFASPASRSILGYDPEELRGRTFFDLCEPEDADLLRQAHQTVLASPDPEVFRYRARRADGRPVWLETTARAVRNGPGEVHEIVSVSRDISARMKADRELRASEERFRTLSTCSPVGIFMSTPEGRLTWVNPRLQEIGGFTFDDALDDGWLGSVHPDDRAWLAELWHGAAAAASPFAAEARFQHADGSVRWVRAAASPMFSDAGELIGHVGAVEDVTDRRLAERALRDSEERYRRLVESSPDGIAVHQEGRFVFVNAAGLRLFGAADPGDIIGRPVWDVIDPSSRGEVQDRIRRLRDGTSATPPTDERLLRLDGTSFDAEAAASACVYEGRPAVQVVIRDITARKSAEQRLRFQASVLSQVDDAVVAVDQAGRITYLNAAAARAYGVAIDDVLGHPAGDLFTTQWLAPQDEGRAAEALRRRGRWEGLSVHVKRSGERIYVESAVSILRDEQGQSAGLLSVIRDVTERIRSEQRQALMMAELDHRVKNNLAAVLSIADHTARSTSSLKEFSESFQGRIRALARMHHVLAKGRWQGARMGELARHTLEPYGARVEAEGPEVTLPARAASPIAMALHELATNASKYGALSTTGGRVGVSWTIHQREGDHPLLRLRWEESGGPRVTEPQRRGFGTELIEGGIAYELRGNVAITWRPEGLVCDMAIPLEPESDRLTPPESPPPPAPPPPVTTRAGAAPPRRTRRNPGS